MWLSGWQASQPVTKALKCRHSWCVETTARSSCGWTEVRGRKLEAEDQEAARAEETLEMILELMLSVMGNHWRAVRKRVMSF